MPPKMDKKKKEKTKEKPVRVKAVNCLFQTVPLEIFGPKILQLLSLPELIGFARAVTNHELRTGWLLARQKKPVAHASEVLRYAINKSVPLVLSCAEEVAVMQKLGFRSKNVRIEFDEHWDGGTAINALALKKFLGFAGAIEALELGKCTSVVKQRSVAALIDPLLSQLTSLRVESAGVGSLIDEMYQRQLGESLLQRRADGWENLTQLMLVNNRFDLLRTDISVTVARLLASLLESNERLETLHLCCWPVSRAVMDALVSLESLTHLHLDCFPLDEAASTQLAGMPPRLRVLHLACCIDGGPRPFGDDFPAVGKARILSVLRGQCGPCLVTLNLSHHHNICLDDETVDVVSEDCPALLHLNIGLFNSDYRVPATAEDWAEGWGQGWGQVTDACLARLADRCPGLQALSLRRHLHFTREGIEALLARCADLRFVDMYCTPRVLENEYLRDRRALLRQEARARGRRPCMLMHCVTELSEARRDVRRWVNEVMGRRIDGSEVR